VSSRLVAVAVVVFAGFDEIDAFAPFEILSMAAPEGGLDVQLVALDGLDDVTASHGTVIRPQGTLSGTRWDVVIVPGGGWAQRRGAFLAAERGDLPRALAELHARGAQLASVCTGAMVLAATGLTIGRPASTHPVARDALRATGAQVIDARVVDDGDLITAGPITSGLDLGLWLVERLCSRELADRVARHAGYEAREDVHFGPRGVRP
jgi:transcriptional regulator GlxA family with amidase domain